MASKVGKDMVDKAVNKYVVSGRENNVGNK